MKVKAERGGRMQGMAVDGPRRWGHMWLVLGKFGPGPIGTRSEPDQTWQSQSRSGIFPKTPDYLVPGLGIPILPETVSDPVWTQTA